MEEKDKPLHLELMQLLSEIKPKYAPTSPAMRGWWNKTALPLLKDSALSQLHRNDECKPQLIGFMHGGGMGAIDLDKATGGFGDNRSKDATAYIQKISAMIPGTIASVFITEAWTLRARTPEDQKLIETRGSIAEHPEREEVVMFNMLHFDHNTGQMMQLMTMVHVMKVLGARRSPKVWRDTKFGEEITTDPMATDDGHSYTGRFVPSNPGEE